MHPLSVVDLVDMLHTRAQRQADSSLYRFLHTGDVSGAKDEWTYGGLDRRARAIAAWLQNEGRPRERVLLLYPPELEFIAGFFGCLYADVIAVPAFPPDPSRLGRTLKRLVATVSDCQARFVFTTSKVLRMAKMIAAQAPELQTLHWVATDSLDIELASSWRRPDIDAHATAFLQYTSGSTGDPKGVMVTHDNVLENERMLYHAIAHDESCDLVGWLPMYHDLGLIGNVLQPIYAGSMCTLMSPLAFLQRPLRWLQAVTEYKPTTCGGPNFAYELCVKKVTEEQRATLDLSSWRIAFNGAEPIHKHTFERFCSYFAPVGFRPEGFFPGYGLAEATLAVTTRDSAKKQPPRTCEISAAALEHGRVTAPESANDTRSFVSVGHTWFGTEIALVDPTTLRRAEPDASGEIWVRGPCVALGYWQREKQTEDVFRAYIADSHEGPYLRTGDIGFELDGELHICGRLKDLIIIRGRNLMPNDLEHTVESSHPGVRPGCSAAFSVERDGEEVLVLVVEIRKNMDESDHADVFDAIRRTLDFEHSTQAHTIALLKPRSIPKTTSGKIQRRASRAGFENGTLDVLATSTIENRSPESTAADAPESERSDEANQAVSDAPPPATADNLDWLIERVAELTGTPVAHVDVRRTFAEYGLDSRAVIGLSGELQERAGREVSPTLLYTFPTIAALAAHLDGTRAATTAIESDRSATRSDEPIAIVGMACRFPGDADDPEAFWKLLQSGVDAVTDVPASRWDIDALYNPDPAHPGTMCTRRGGFLRDIDQFDARFFGVNPREAMALDPQQRLLMEVTWHALEDAGIAVDRLEGTRTGVFVGMSSSDYARLTDSGATLADIDPYTGTGVAMCVAAGRLSYILGLRGPSLTLDTACSSSLVAIHLACQSLRRGESERALAGGVNLLLSPEGTVYFSRVGAMAPDGRCKSFDESADGYVRSEGCGMIVLEPLSVAQAQGHRVIAVIRGSAINHDGRSNGLTAPSTGAQEAVIRAALADANVAAAEVGYVETHGTGTALGDPIEVTALAATVGVHRADGREVMLGAVKSQIGHAEAAAGVAGLIKTALVVQRGQIPGNLHFHIPNPHAPWTGSGVRVADAPMDWPATVRPRIAGVSSFGFSGTNAHVVLAQPPSERDDSVGDSVPRPDDELRLVPLSARSDDGLRALADSYAHWLRTSIVTSKDTQTVRSQLTFQPGLDDICRTVSTGRAHHDHRLALTVTSVDQLHRDLSSFSNGQLPSSAITGRRPTSGRPPIVFVFSGQGSQWPGMARDLLAYNAVFRDAMYQCDQAVQRTGGLSVLDELHAEEHRSRLDSVDVIQPVLFSIQVALADTWRSLGVTPDAVIGHSMGEVAAAVTTGALSLDDGAQVICQRSQLLRRVRGKGGMLLVELTFDEAARAIADTGGIDRSDHVSIAACNSPRTTVLSGSHVELEALHVEFEIQGIFGRWVKVDIASHSPQMDPLCDELVAGLSAIIPRAGSTPMVSTVTGEPCADAQLDAAYWGTHLRQPVLFSTALAQLIDSGHAMFVEISPHPILAPTFTPEVKRRHPDGIAIASMRRNRSDRDVLLEALGAVYAHGGDIDWHALSGTRGHLVSMPTYPFQRQRYWLPNTDASFSTSTAMNHASKRTDFARMQTRGPSPLLGESMSLSFDPRIRLYQRVLDLNALPWLVDHQVHDTVVLPATGYVEMAMTSARHALGPGSQTLDDLAIEAPLVLVRGMPVTVQLALTIEGPDTARIRIASQYATPGANTAWTVHATGVVRKRVYDDAVPMSIADARARCTETIDGPTLYQQFADLGLKYGPAFRGIEAIERRDGEALGRISFGHFTHTDAYTADPMLVDTCLHALFGALPASRRHDNQGAWVPVGADRISLDQPLIGIADSTLWSHVTIDTTASAENTLRADVTLLSGSGHSLLSIVGLRVRQVSMDTIATRAPVDIVSLHWRPTPAPTETRPEGSRFALIGGPAALSDRIRATLEQRGYAAEIVTDQNMAASGWHPHAYAAIVHLGSLQSIHLDQPTLSDFDRAHQSGVDSVLTTTIAIAQTEHPPRLYLVTRGVHAIAPEDTCTGVAQAPLWGLGRVIANEHPELRATLVDIDERIPVDNEQLTEAVCAEIVADDPETEVGWRAGQRFVARLQARADESFRSPDPSLRLGAVNPDGTYLITGGVGGLGRTVARDLVNRGARHLVLVSRRGIADERAQAAIDEMTSTGAQVTLAAADIADPAALQGILDTIADTMPPICGVVHAAGVLDDGIILQQTPERLRSVMAPKVAGAWNLHQMSGSRELDIFVLFSSVASLMGSPGQGNYAAANAFLDALAHHRRARGMSALSVNWGPFSEVGMAAADPQRGERLAKLGIASLAPAECPAQLFSMLRADIVQSGVMRMNIVRFARAFPVLHELPIWSEWLAETPQISSSGDLSASAPLHQTLADTPPDDRKAVIETFVSSAIARVMRLERVDIDRDEPLTSLGMDSLLGVELRNQLEAALDINLPTALLWKHPTLAAISEQLLTLWLQARVTTGSGTNADDESTAEAQNDDVEEFVL